MRDTMRRLWKIASESRLRLGVLAIAAAALVLVAFLLAQRRSGNALRHFPVETLDAKTPQQFPTASSFPVWAIHGISPDGKTVALYNSPSVGTAECWFFDVEQRRFHAKGFPFYAWDPARRLLFEAGWDQDFLLYAESRSDTPLLSSIVRRLRGRSQRNWGCRTSVYVLNLSGRRSRHLLDVKTNTSRNFGRVLLRVNDAKTLVTYCSLFQAPKETVVLDLETERRNAIDLATLKSPGNRASFLWGWLPDNRTLAFWGTERARLFGKPKPQNLLLVDLSRENAVRTLRIAELFRWRHRGKNSASGEKEIRSFEPIAFLDQCRRVRLLATFDSDERAPGGAYPYKWSIWDLDIQTERLLRRMDFELGSPLRLYSPSGAAVLSSLTPTLVGEAIEISPMPFSIPLPSRTYTSASLAIHRIGDRPHRLPFQVFVESWTGGGFVPGNLVLPDFVGRQIRFLDEHTLFHTGSGKELWTFDLRTSESTLLWPPKRDKQQEP